MGSIIFFKEMVSWSGAGFPLGGEGWDRILLRSFLLRRNLLHWKRKNRPARRFFEG